MVPSLSLHRVPREGGDPDEGLAAVRSRSFWVPACAGNTEVEKTRPPSALRATSPKGGRSKSHKSSPSGGSTGVAGVGGLSQALPAAFPAKAGIQTLSLKREAARWSYVFAGKRGQETRPPSAKPG